MPLTNKKTTNPTDSVNPGKRECLRVDPTGGFPRGLITPTTCESN